MASEKMPAQNTAADEARSWLKNLVPYQTPNLARSIFEIVITVGLFVACWVLMWLALGVSYWISLALVLPAAGLLVRLFVIQHDCGHGAFFKNRTVNDWVGRVIGIFTLTPYDFWKRTHAIHHAGTGNLDRRGLGDIDTLTVREYEALSPGRKLLYRVYRNPVVLFAIGPAYQFFLQHRLPIGLMRRGWTPWVSTMATNVGIVVVVALGMWLAGVQEFLIIQVPVMLLATSIGVWMFYVHHQYENTYWDHEKDWSRAEAALHGSSHYDLPGVLRWISGNIGVHHVHHLSSRIPFYKLYDVLRDHPELVNVGRITLMESFRCVPLTLWDEDTRQLISFREQRLRAAA
ncbi:fatty acid desaturase [bacterium BMS3Bbin10]|nr:fatty acid desaturase [bacterium BMS3Bbin10]